MLSICQMPFAYCATLRTNTVKGLLAISQLAPLLKYLLGSKIRAVFFPSVCIILLVYYTIFSGRKREKTRKTPPFDILIERKNVTSSRGPSLSLCTAGFILANSPDTGTSICTSIIMLVSTKEYLERPFPVHSHLCGWSRSRSF